MTLPYEGFCSFEVKIDAPGYPRSLYDLADPPLLLHGIGDIEALETNGLAIVGARKATPYGLECTTMFAERAAALGITIVSGGAIGCDQAAARAAVAKGTRSIVVMAGGADVVYPKGGHALFMDVLGCGGCIVSEQEWGMPPLPALFVQRNRIIAGLAQATLIVEAGLGSGTFSTADASLAAGHDVLVVPGSIHSPESRGSNRLLFQGASPVVDMESFDTQLMTIFGVVPLSYSNDLAANERAGLSPCQARLVAMLAANPLYSEAIAKHMGLDPMQTACLIGECEGFGIIERYRDGRWGIPVLRRWDGHTNAAKRV